MDISGLQVIARYHSRLNSSGNLSSVREQTILSEHDILLARLDLMILNHRTLFINVYSVKQFILSYM